MSTKLPFRYDSRTMDPLAGAYDQDQANQIQADLLEHGEIVNRLRQHVEKLAELVKRNTKKD